MHGHPPALRSCGERDRMSRRAQNILQNREDPLAVRAVGVVRHDGTRSCSNGGDCRSMGAEEILGVGVHRALSRQLKVAGALLDEIIGGGDIGDRWHLLHSRANSVVIVGHEPGSPRVEKASGLVECHASVHVGTARCRRCTNSDEIAP